MPEVNGKHFSYSKKGRAAAKAAMKKKKGSSHSSHGSKSLIGGYPGK